MQPIAIRGLKRWLRAPHLLRQTGLIAILACLVDESLATTCYDWTGQVNTDFLPCNSTGTSLCCKPEDFCTTKGLCLHGEIFLLGVYGCTDPNWGPPCQKPCPGQGGFANILFPCAQAENSPAVNKVGLGYCCGPDPASCCGSSQFVNISYVPDISAAVWRAISTTSTTVPSTTALTTGTNTIVTTTNSVTTPIGAATNQGQSVTNPEGRSNKSLAIALGVGISLGVLLIAALAYVGWQLQRYNGRTPESKQVTTETGHSTSIIHEMAEIR